MGRHEWRVIAEYGQGFFNDTHPAVVAMILSTAGTTVTGTSADQNPLKTIGNSIHDAASKTGKGVGNAASKTGKAVKDAAKAVGNAVQDVFK
jgi:hypothetical protein